jgi:F-type H+-transporting ATPase subunit b
LLAIPAFVLFESGDNIIQPNVTLVVVIILFIIFVFVLNQILFKPIGKVLDERETLTEGAAAEARAAARQYQARLNNYEETIRQARAESYRKLEQQRKAALDERSKLVESARALAEAEIAKARAEVAAQTAEARTALEQESRQIAEQISRTLLGRALGGGNS